MVLKQPESSDKSEYIKATNQMITSNSQPLTVGYTALICGNVVVYITDVLNIGEGSNHYSFEVLPVIYPVEGDCRKDKCSNYVIIKLRKRRTIAIYCIQIEING